MQSDVLSTKPRSVARRPRDPFRRAILSTRGIIVLSLLTLFILMALLAPFVTPFGPNEIVGGRLESPGSEFLLGTDYVGRDVLTRLLYGARASLLVGVLAALIAVTVGTAVGATAGYFGGAIDNVLMRITELLQIMPVIIITIVVAAIFQADMFVVILLIGLTTWTFEARIIRAQFFTLREREFVSAARVMGMSTPRIVFREIFPNAFPPLIVQGAMSVGDAILVEAFLSFLGIGDSSVPTWGQMISTAQASLSSAPLQSLLPGLLILCVVVTFNLVADLMNDAFNPRVALRTKLARLVAIRQKGRGVSFSEPRAAGLHADRGVDPGPMALEATDLSITINAEGQPVHAVRNVSIQVAAGEIVGVVGESGSGKSTLARLIAVLPPVADIESMTGSVSIAGQDLSALSPEELRRRRRGLVSMIFQEPLSYLNPTMTLGDQIGEAIDPKVPRQGRKKEVADLLTRVGLTPAESFARRYPHQASGGQRQRAMIALALAMRPRLLIADEPTTALDVTVQAEILKLIVELRDELGFGVLVISHDLGLIATISDHMYVMHQGEFVESGPTAEIFAHPQNDYTKKLLNARRDLVMGVPAERSE